MAPLLTIQAQKLLVRFGITCLEVFPAHTEKQCLFACRRAGFPVLLRAVISPGQHGSAGSAFTVVVRDEKTAIPLYRKLLAEVRGAKVRLREVQAQRYLDGAAACVCGVGQDAQFGPYLFFRSPAPAIRFPPITREEAHTMVQEARLAGGGPAAVILSLSALAMKYPKAEILLEPLLVRPGGEVVVGGCVVRL